MKNSDRSSTESDPKCESSYANKMSVIKDLHELKKFIKLCRAEGVESIRFDGVEMFLGQKPETGRKGKNSPGEIGIISTTAAYAPGGIAAHTPIPVPDVKISTDELSDEEMLFYSVTESQEQGSET